MFRVCAEQAEWMRGERERSIYGDDYRFIIGLVSDTERSNLDLLARINEYGLLSNAGQMGECKDITNDKRVFEYYGSDFLDLVNPIDPETFSSMTEEEQDASIEKSMKLLHEEVISMKVTENYGICGLCRAISATYLQREFVKDSNVIIRFLPFARYVMECASGHLPENEVTNKQTMVSIVTKTKGEHTVSKTILGFPTTAPLHNVLGLLKDRKDAMHIKREIFEEWGVIMIECTDPCINLAERIYNTLKLATDDKYFYSFPTKIGKGKNARMALRLLNK